MRTGLAEGGLTAVVSGLPSDSHTWGLVFLQFLLEDIGYSVVNLGACVPAGLVVGQCLAHRPDLLVLSSVNGHGHVEASDVIRRIRSTPALEGMTVVIGGKLGVRGEDNARFATGLLKQGFDAVFGEAESSLALQHYLGHASLPPGRHA